MSGTEAKEQSPLEEALAACCPSFGSGGFGTPMHGAQGKAAGSVFLERNGVFGGHGTGFGGLKDRFPIQQAGDHRQKTRGHGL